MTGTQEWRLKMDMFMDKLAQKLTAQEIIKANTAADTEELNKLKGQVKDYSACLDSGSFRGPSGYHGEGADRPDGDF